MSVAAPQKC